MPQKTARETTVEFLRFLFDPYDDGVLDGCIVTTNVARKDIAPRFNHSIDDAADFLHAPENAGVSFIGACLQNETEARRAAKNADRNPAFARGTSRTATSVPGMWIDVDVQDPAGHKRDDLPPTVAAALVEIGEAMPCQPTLVVQTGGGVHLWFLFDEGCHEITSDADRARMERIVCGWQEIARDALAKRGWSLDSTHDLARAMRVPGTRNTKYHPPRDVKLEYVKGTPRHTIDEFECLIPDETFARADDRLARRGSAQISVGADAANGHVTPIDMTLTDERFAAVHATVQRLITGDITNGVEPNRALELRWAHSADWDKAAGLERMADKSQSAFDLSIATILMRTGALTDEEIVDAMRLHRTLPTSPAWQNRERRGEAGRQQAERTIAVKHQRTDYYLDRLALARSATRRERLTREANQSIEEALSGVAEPEIRKAKTPKPAAIVAKGDVAESGPVRARAASAGKDESEVTASKESQQKALQALSAALGLDEAKNPVVGVRVVGDGRKRRYALRFTRPPRLDQGCRWEFIDAPLGSARAQAATREAVFEGTGLSFPPMKAEAFAAVRRVIQFAAEHAPAIAMSMPELHDDEFLAAFAQFVEGGASWVVETLFATPDGFQDHTQIHAAPRSPEWHGAVLAGASGLVYWSPTDGDDVGVLVRPEALAKGFMGRNGLGSALAPDMRVSDARSALCDAGILRERPMGADGSTRMYLFASLVALERVLGRGAHGARQALVETHARSVGNGDAAPSRLLDAPDPASVAEESEPKNGPTDVPF